MTCTRRWGALLVAVLAACGRIGFSARGGDGGGTGEGVDAPIVRRDGPFAGCGFAPRIAGDEVWPSPERPSELAAGDLDGDGAVDLAIVEGTNGTDVRILLGNGDGTFAPSVSYATATAPESVAVGHIDGGGALDVVTANYLSGSISVFLGNGDGTLAPRVDFNTATAGGGPRSVAIVDLDRNGMSDIATASYFADEVSVFMRQASGFAAAVPYATDVTPFAIVAADVTGDGVPDLATANASRDTVTVLVGNGDGTFAPRAEYDVANGPEGIAAGDLDHDGRADLAVTSIDGTVEILLATPTGFAPRASYVCGAGSLGVEVRDLDGDGNLDVAVANVGADSVSVLLGVGDGTQRPAATLDVGSGPRELVVARIDGDIHPDLVVGNTDVGTISTLLSTCQP